MRSGTRLADTPFAHPAEEALARILSFYRIPWFYEPTSFVLRHRDDGRPAESFTPDFFLPSQNLYIELTTMRQPLVTRKNRKLRRLRELYPGVRVRLLYRRDVERLLRAYEEEWRAPAIGSAGKVVATQDQIECRTAELARQIAADLRFARQDASPELVVVGLEPGADRFHADLVARLRQLGVGVEADRARITRYQATCEEATVRLSRAPRSVLRGRDVLVVAEVVSTGFSLAYLRDWLRERKPRSVEICTLFDRSGARLIDLPIGFSGFEASDEPIVGYGIGFDPKLRDLPYVVALRRDDPGDVD